MYSCLVLRHCRCVHPRVTSGCRLTARPELHHFFSSVYPTAPAPTSRPPLRPLFRPAFSDCFGLRFCSSIFEFSRTSWLNPRLLPFLAPTLASRPLSALPTLSLRKLPRSQRPQQIQNRRQRRRLSLRKSRLVSLSSEKPVCPCLARCCARTPLPPSERTVADSPCAC